MRSLYELYSEKVREFLRTGGKWGSGAYIAAGGEPRSIESGDLPLWRRSDTRVSKIVGCLFI